MDDDYSLPFQKLELEQIPFEIMETALYDLLRYWKEKKDILYEIEGNLPSTIAHLRIYTKDTEYHFDETQTVLLGYIRMMKLSDVVTQLELQCLVTGEKQKLFKELIDGVKAHTATFSAISKAVVQRNKGRGRKKPKKGKPGRRSFSEDIWAWNQVNTLKRPINEVYEEWLENRDVQKRKLIDPKTHFYRFIKRNKMGD
jgi:hypothetical protein